MIDFGKKIRQFCEAKGYSQEYMAGQLNLSASGFGKLERNETELTINRLQEIIEALGLSLNDFLGQSESGISFNNTGDNSQNNISVNSLPQTEREA